MGRWIVIQTLTNEVQAVFRRQEHALNYMEDYEHYPMEYTLAYQDKEIE